MFKLYSLENEALNTRSIQPEISQFHTWKINFQIGFSQQKKKRNKNGAIASSYYDRWKGRIPCVAAVENSRRNRDSFAIRYVKTVFRQITRNRLVSSSPVEIKTAGFHVVSLSGRTAQRRFNRRIWWKDIASPCGLSNSTFLTLFPSAGCVSFSRHGLYNRRRLLSFSGFDSKELYYFFQLFNRG